MQLENRLVFPISFPFPFYQGSTLSLFNCFTLLVMIISCFVQGKIDKRVEPFSVRQKQFWDVCESRTLLGPKFTKESLGHEPDGLIFQPSPDVRTTVFCISSFTLLKLTFKTPHIIRHFHNLDPHCICQISFEKRDFIKLGF